MTETTPTSKTAGPVPVWTIFAVFVGLTTVTGWLFRQLVGEHDSFDHPNATSMSIDTKDELSYIVEPLPSGVELILGILGLVLLVAGVRELVKPRKYPDTTAVVAIFLSILAGLLMGGAWASVTYGTIDANIGGGIALIFGVPMALFMFAVALFIRYLQHRSLSK